MAELSERALCENAQEPDAPMSAAGVLAEAVEQVRGRTARLQDLMARSGPDPRASSLSPDQSPGDQMHEVSEVAAWAEQKVSVALQRVAICQAMIAQLAAVAQHLSGIEGLDELMAAVPALALAVFPRAAVALLKVGGDGSVQALARAGAPFEARQAQLDDAARVVVLAAGPRPANGAGAGVGGAASAARRVGRALVVPVSRTAERWALAVEREDGAASAGDDLDELTLLASLVGSALESARASDSWRAAVARDTAVLAAIRDGVLVVDRSGVVRAANPAALAVLGLRREELVGRLLAGVPGLAPLAAALASAGGDTDVVTTPRGDVSVRAQPYEHGFVATLREAAGGEQTSGKRSAAGPAARYHFENMVGRDPGLLRVIEDARRAARSDMPVLICGESGTGKELLAQAIHNASARASAPFIGVNVTAIPRELPESELFGYEAGAFTGARPGGNAGKFELAGRGTLLLDEIGDMPAEMQAKLLRVLQERVVQRVGSARDIPVRARIMATSHRDLPEAVTTGRFRLDLFHRLCVIHLHLPPLRERKGDVPLIVEHQLQLHAERTGRRVRLAPHALDLLEAYDWPGNVRELVNLIEGELGVLAPGEEAFTRLPEALLHVRTPANGGADPAVLSLEELERRACEETLARFSGNVARAATALGVAKGTLYAKIKRYGLDAAPRASRPTPLPRNGGSGYEGGGI